MLCCNSAMAGMDPAKYAHSPVHRAVLARDYATLRRILSSIPRISQPCKSLSEAESMAEEEKAEVISSVIDRRDVPKRETPLHLAVKLADVTAVEILMAAGADSSLQNKQGWSPLHEAVCAREEQIAKIILRHYQPLAWAKWCRRMPRLVATMRRMRDFYMEIDFHFESSVIPFISRVAPSDTYKIWKRGSNLRADMTLSGFDGFKIQRADQSILFLGEGSEDGKVKPGSLCIVSHKDKEVLNALDGAGGLPSEAELQQEVETMLRTNILRPGLDVTRAALLPQMNWRKQQRSEMIGPWMAEVYNMHHVVVSVKSRHVPGAMADEEIFSNCKNDDESDEQMDMLTEEERKQLEAALKMEDCADQDTSFHDQDTSFHDQNSTLVNDIDSTSHSGGGEQQKERKGWIANWKKKGKNHKHDVEKKDVAPRRSPHVEDKARDLSELQKTPGRVESKKSGTSSDNAHRRKESGKDNEYKKGLRPVLWLSPNFPLQIEELLPLLDILANKVKAIHRLRELLTTKLPTGTFPVKVAIPVVPTVRVLVTFTKFEELQPPSPEEFCTPPSSPESESPQRHSSSSWAHWMTAPYKSANSYFKASPDPSSCSTDLEDPFTIPLNYVWTTPEAKKKKKIQEAGGNVKKKQS